MNLLSGYDTADCWYLPTRLCVVDKNSPYWPLRRTFLFSLKFGRGQNAQNALRTRTLSRLAHERGRNLLVIPPNSNTFSDWRRACHVGAMGQNSLTPEGNNNLNFRLARDQVFETEANLLASWRQAYGFFAVFLSLS